MDPSSYSHACVHRWMGNNRSMETSACTFCPVIGTYGSFVVMKISSLGIPDSFIAAPTTFSVPANPAVWNSMSTPTSCCNCSGERVYQWGQNEVSHVKVGLLNRIWQDWFGLTVHKGCINMPISNLHRIVMTSVNEVTAVWHPYLQGAYYPILHTILIICDIWTNGYRNYRQLIWASSIEPTIYR